MPTENVGVDAGVAVAVSDSHALGLFAGADAWNFPGYPPLGYPPVQVADCGHGVTLVAPPYGSATCFPTSVGMAATWNRTLLEQVGRVLGLETLAKGCGMLLGPMVNLHRLPCGGRNYETFSEDPVLTGKLAAAIIRGIQSVGAGACVKSFACNNQQHAQKTTSSNVDPRTLRELYLKVFEIVLRESQPWAVMTSYNAINGENPAESRHWIESVLRGELGFQDLVVSDWGAINSDSALDSGVDMEMPGPGRFLTASCLQQALNEGRISARDWQLRVERVLRFHERCTPARQGRCPPPELDTPQHRALALRVAEESITLLRNVDRLLPLDRNQIKTLAVIGPNAMSARLGGGGSASVSPFYQVSPLEGIRAAAGPGIEIRYLEGCSLGNSYPVIATEYLKPVDGAVGEGLTASYFEVAAFFNGGPPSVVRTDLVVDFSWGWASPANGLPRENYVVRWDGFMVAPAPGNGKLAVTAQEGVARVWIDDTLILDAWSEYDPTDFESKYANRHAQCLVDWIGGQMLAIRIEYWKTGTRGGIHLGWRNSGAMDPIDQAVALARAADAVIVVGGLSNVFEGGSYDRRSFELPGRQELLIRQVAAANPRTVVVLKNGTPVAMNGWRESVGAILEAYYPGQEGGNAIGRIIWGDVNPSGRLPDTIPNNWQEVPSMAFYPGDGQQAEYGERLMIGYRHYDQAGIEPAYPFGFGLSYSEFVHEPPRIIGPAVLRPGAALHISTRVRNSGPVVGQEVVQCYLEFVDPAPDRPPRMLVDFSKIELAVGQSAEVVFTIGYSQLLTFNPARHSWGLEHHCFRVCTGPHSRQLAGVPFEVPAG
jgi:beta-glucosidase